MKLFFLALFATVGCLFRGSAAICDGDCGDCVPKPGSDVPAALCSACVGALAHTLLCSPRSEECICREDRRLWDTVGDAPLQFLPFMVGDLPMAVVYPELTDGKDQRAGETRNITVYVNASPVSTNGEPNASCSTKLVSAFSGDSADFFDTCALLLEVRRGTSDRIRLQGDSSSCFGKEWIQDGIGTVLPNVRSGGTCQNQCQKADDCVYFSFVYNGVDLSNGGECRMLTQAEFDEAKKGSDGCTLSEEHPALKCHGVDTCFSSRRSAVAGKAYCLGKIPSVCKM